jgi:hypothetical protein
VGGPSPTNNDPSNQIRFATRSAADARRQALSNYIWAGGLPVNTLPAVTLDIGPTDDLSGISAPVSQVDLLDVNVSGFDFHSKVYLLHLSIRRTPTPWSSCIRATRRRWYGVLERLSMSCWVADFPLPS